MPVAAIGVVVLAIVVGLVISGSPMQQRELRLDEARVADLRSLSAALARFYRETAALPGSLEQLVDGRNLSRLPRDPVADTGYSYTQTSPAAYRLCTEFARASDTSLRDDFWTHAAGRHCFEFDYSDLRPD